MNLDIKKIISTLLFFISVFCSAQNVGVLDEKNGYKIFKLNSDKIKHHKNLNIIENKNNYSVYNYVQKYDYYFVNENRRISRDIGWGPLAQMYYTTPQKIRELNPDIKTKRRFLVKKNQNILVPIRKISKMYPIDQSLFDLFGFKIKSIHLTYENSTNKLKKINLEITEEKSVVAINGYLESQLKNIYYNFAEIIGPTNGLIRPSKDCRYNSCLFFLERAFKGEILWQSNNLVLKVIQDTEPKISDNGIMSILISQSISFSDINFENSLKNNSF